MGAKSSVSATDKKAADLARAKQMTDEADVLRQKARNLSQLFMGSNQSKAVYNKQANMAEEDAEVLTERAKQLRQAASAKPAMAKGGAVMKKAPATKPAMKKAPALAVMIAVGKPKAKMAKGGAVVAKAPAKKAMK